MLIMFTQIFGFYAIQNNEMQPKLMAGDLTLFYRIGSKYRSSNVVVYKAKGKKHVGRIIAVPGDTVEITKDGKLIINGSTVIETEIYYTTTAYDGDEVEYPVKLKKNQYFILGDYREGAKDSRYFGPVSKKNILGEVITAIRRGNL